MGWESSDVVRFDLGPLLQGQTRIAKDKSAFNSFILSDLTLGPSFKVKQWFTGFQIGELSFRSIQICICSSIRRSNLNHALIMNQAFI